jgi:hypothetical protein
MLIQILNLIVEIFYTYFSFILNSICSFYFYSSQNISLVLNSILINDILINVLICFLALFFLIVSLTRIPEVIGRAIMYGAGVATIAMASGVLPPNKDDDDEDKKKAEEEAKRREEEEAVKKAEENARRKS